ncbi:hypothetical protein EG68_06957 [Paragonimus skrjabini miyazakii]|uniref:Uncharacterized protein n=1 Tax=Paragonimus skrjabini miyazakii TaxID=59628 RepID=A0A8S9YNB5_9TREM|nr:hypothetical protein EG68_06957 [Paragonimus skrjabini miyazakii]
MTIRPGNNPYTRKFEKIDMVDNKRSRAVSSFAASPGRYRLGTPKLDFLHASTDDLGLGRHTNASKLRSTFQLLKFGRCVSGSCVNSNKSFISMNRRERTLPAVSPVECNKAEPVYISLKRKLAKQLKLAPEKLYGFLLGSQVTKQVTRLTNQPITLRSKSSSKNKVNGRHIVSSPQERISRELSEMNTFAEISAKEQIDATETCVVNVSNGIRRSVNLSGQSMLEQTCRLSNGSPVQLTIIGNSRNKCGNRNQVDTLRKTAIDTDSFTPRRDSYGPLRNSTRITSPEYGCREYLNCQSPIATRAVSIPSWLDKPEHNLCAAELCVIGNRPSNVTSSRSVSLTEAEANENWNDSRVTDCIFNKPEGPLLRVRSSTSQCLRQIENFDMQCEDSHQQVTRRSKDSDKSFVQKSCKKSIMCADGSKQNMPSVATPQKDNVDRPRPDKVQEDTVGCSVPERDTAFQDTRVTPETPDNLVQEPKMKFKPFTVDHQGGLRPISPVLQCGEHQPF